MDAGSESEPEPEPGSESESNPDSTHDADGDRDVTPTTTDPASDGTAASSVSPAATADIDGAGDGTDPSVDRNGTESPSATLVAGLPVEGTVSEIADAIESRAGRDPARIAVDVDRTLTTGDGDPWYVDGLAADPNERCVAVVNELYSRGHTIIVWTARPWSVAAETAGWLTGHGIRYHGLRMAKGSSHVYLDDKALDSRSL